MQWDTPVETGWFWLSSRYYNPEWGRFISPDDIEYLDPKSVNGLNLYCYCGNNPVNFVDSSGHFVIPVPASISQFVFKIISNFMTDVINFDFSNKDEQKVLDANYFSYYRGAFVVKIDFMGNLATSFSIFGTMFINSKNNDRGTDTIKHEWGHLVQEKMYGELLYIMYIAIPSITNRNPPINYYSQSWEHGADVFGGVQGYPYYTNDAYNNFLQYHEKIMNIRRRFLRSFRIII